MKQCKFVTILLFVITTIIIAREQRIAYGFVTGKVIDAKTEKVISNALVQLNDGEYIDSTDADGKFTVDSLLPGRYDFEINADDYSISIKPSIQVKTGINKELVFTLQKANIQELDKMVISTGKLEVKQPEQTTSVIKLSREEIKSSPGALEDINEVLKILPSAIGSGEDWDNSMQVRGGSDNENVYLVDGLLQSTNVGILYLLQHLIIFCVP